jgi:hypothetical protein
MNRRIKDDDAVAVLISSSVSYPRPDLRRSPSSSRSSSRSSSVFYLRPDPRPDLRRSTILVPILVPILVSLLSSSRSSSRSSSISLHTPTPTLPPPPSGCGLLPPYPVLTAASGTRPRGRQRQSIRCASSQRSNASGVVKRSTCGAPGPWNSQAALPSPWSRQMRGRVA